MEKPSEVADLKKHVDKPQQKVNWIDAITGTFRDNPEFDEILRLGKEIRDADQPTEDFRNIPNLNAEDWT